MTTYDEIADLWGVAKTAAFRGVQVLEKMGRIKIVPGIARGIQIREDW